MIDLITQYKTAKRLANRIDIDPANAYVDEAEVVRGMVADIDYAITWMREGAQPNVKLRGTGVKNIYTKRLMLDTKMFPSLDIEPIDDDRKLTDHKKKLIHIVLSELSERQLTCFLLHTAHMRTYEEIAAELGIKASSVQKHIERAREKIEKIVKEYKLELPKK